MVWSLPVFPYLPSVSFLAFMPFLWQFLLASFPPSFLSVDLGFSFPILFFLLLHLHVCQVSAFPPVISFRLQVVFIIHVAFSSGGFVFPPGFIFWNEAKTKAKTKANFTTSSLELANLLPHPATTPTITIATAGPSYVFAAGMCLTTTSKAPTPPSLRWLLLAPILPLLLPSPLLLLDVLLVVLLVVPLVAPLPLSLPLLLLILLLLVAAAVAAVTAVTACRAVRHCYCSCCCHCHCYCSCSCSCCLRCHCWSSSTFVASTSHSTNPGRSRHILLLFFYNFCHCCCH